MSFERWKSRIEDAQDENARRRLLGEVGVWRAAHLADVPGLRDAAFAMSNLYGLIGDEDGAVREARALISLCQTPPLAMKEEFEVAQAYLNKLGEDGIVVLGDDQLPRKSGLDWRGRLALFVDEGNFKTARRLLKGRKDKQKDLLMAWLSLSEALTLNAEEQARAFETLAEQMRSSLRLPGGKKKKAAPNKKGANTKDTTGKEATPETAEEQALSALLGRKVSRHRKRRLMSYQIFLREHAGKAAALVDAVLAHHVANTSLSAPAPWLSSVIGPALACSPDVQAVLEQWRQKGASCVDLYQDASCTALVEVVRQAKGWQVQSLRRGVVSRDEAGGRRLWTLRMTLDGRERLLAIAPVRDEDSSQERERKRATRIQELCASALVVAPGEGNAKLRAAAAKLGLQVCEQELSAEELVQRLAALEGVERSKRGERGREERKDKTTSSRSEPSDESAQAAKDLQAHLLRPQWDKDQLVTIVCKLHRVREGFRSLRAVAEQDPAAVTDEKLDTFLAALEEGAPAEVRLSEGTSLGILMASTTGPDGLLYKRLVERPEGRLSGPGIEQVIALSAAATAAGCEVRRVLRGSTVKERRKHNRLDEHDSHTQGLWRLLISRGSARGELWFIDSLAEQGRGAASLLADFSRNFVIARAADEEALSWLDDTLAQRVLAWTPGDSAALDVAVGGWDAE